MKKLFLILILILNFSAFAYADTAVTVSLETVTAEIGQEIEMNISISEYSKMSGGNFVIIYDNTALEIISAQQTSLLSGYSCFINTEYAANKIKASWAGTGTLESGGTIFVLRFKALSESRNKENVLFEKLKLADIDDNRINAVSENGTVNIVSNTPAPSGGSSFSPSPAAKNNTPDKTEENTVIFKDVSKNDWFYESVKYVYENNLMKGISDTEFAPQNNLTRAMFVTVIYRIENEPETAVSVFKDVANGSWYEKAVAWASANNIVNGISDTEFAPDSSITREQMATIIYRFAKYKNPNISAEENTDLTSYNDFKDISAYATEAFRYVCEKGIITGMSDTLLAPKENATRAQAATIFMRVNSLIH